MKNPVRVDVARLLEMVGTRGVGLVTAAIAAGRPLSLPRVLWYHPPIALSRRLPL